MLELHSNYDAVIAGSGPGGATVARELSREGKKVLILEWGNNDPVRGTFGQMLPQAFVPGKSLLRTGQFLGIIRGITTGGSSLFYCATAFEPPVDMLKQYGVDIGDEAAEIRLRKGREHAAKILRHMGAEDIHNSWVLAAHPGGTVKIGRHLDTDLQTEIQNLYVCDCSVIPKEWGLPPTFTILSLAKRLAKHLLASY